MKIKDWIPLLCFFAIALGVILYSMHMDKKANFTRKTLPDANGTMDKLEYRGHSYIGWTCNLGCSMVHDPDCRCGRKD